MTRIFTKTQLLEEFEILYSKPGKQETWGRVLYDKIVSHSRWSLIYELAFQLNDDPDDVAWVVTYSVGATEQQEETPWEYETEITANKIFKQTKTLECWVDEKGNFVEIHKTKQR